MTESGKNSVQITAENTALSDLKLSWATMEFTAENGIGPMRSLHEAGDSLVGVARMDDNGTTIIGSGVMVGPGLLLTATHVLQEFSQANDMPVFMTFLPGCVRAWLPIETVTASGKSDFDPDRKKVSDISLVSCTLNSLAHEKHSLMLTTLQVALPLIGERFWAFGLRHQFIDDEGVASLTPLVSSGIVTAVFPQGRGERMPSPCFEVDMDTLGGMSGGPVVNATGDVVGIVSSSFDGGPTYVTLIWDALRFNIKGAVPAFSHRKEINLIYAKQLDLVRIKGDVQREPWGDIVFKMTNEEAALFKNTCDIKNLTSKQDVLIGDELDQFEDEWGYDLERFASRTAIEYLEALPVDKVKEFLAASNAIIGDMRNVQKISAEDFEGVEDPRVTSSIYLDDGRLKLEYYFNLLSVVWTIDFSKEYYSDNETEFTGFFNSQVTDDSVSMEAFQKCGFRMTVIFNTNSEEFEEGSITWAAVHIPRKKNAPRSIVPFYITSESREQ